MIDNSEQPLVSVIIPAYNSEKVLNEAIESILNQTHQHLECIIIDDNSTDGTWNIIQNYAAKDPRIVASKNAANIGVAKNRNRGIGIAKAEYICWQDADDVALPRRIELQLKVLQHYPEVGIVGGFMEFFGEGTKKSVRKYAAHDSDLRKTIFKFNSVAQPASMCRASCYKAVGLYNERYKVSEDLDMLFRIGRKYKFANVQHVLLRYRQDKSSLTRANLRLMELTAIKVRRQYARDSAYHPTLSDYAYNLAQLLSLYVIPPQLRVALFTFFRNS